MKDQTIEITICFVVSFVLIFLFLSKPESDISKAVVDNDVFKIRQMIRMSRNLDEPGPCQQTHSSYSTPLIEAAFLGRNEIILDLLNAGADVNARDDMGTTPLMAALSQGDVQNSSLLLEKGADPNLATCLGHGSCTTPLRCARKLNNILLINKIESIGGHEDTSGFFVLECFWLSMKPAIMMVLAQIVPLVFFIMLSGSFIRRRFKQVFGKEGKIAK